MTSTSPLTNATAMSSATSNTNSDFYITFNMFRLATIFHGIKGRLARGTATSTHAQEYAAGVEWMAALGWQQAQRAKLTEQ